MEAAADVKGREVTTVGAVATCLVWTAGQLDLAMSAEVGCAWATVLLGGYAAVSRRRRG